MAVGSKSRGNNGNIQYVVDDVEKRSSEKEEKMG